VKYIQVKHSRELGREYRERERDAVNRGERERTEMLRENGVGFKRRSTLVDFDRWSKSTLKYFWRLQMAESNFDTRQKVYSASRIFLDKCLSPAIILALHFLLE
jgi:hypothetical protein